MKEWLETGSMLAMNCFKAGTLEDCIRQQAIELGFDHCRFTHARTPGTWPSYRSWVDAGMHGKMEYLARHSAKKADLSTVLPQVKSVITLAVSYFPGDSGVDEIGEMPVGAKGTVARYARYEDYHDVLKPALVRLVETIQSMVGPDENHLYYMDTGPIMERDLAQRSGLGFVGKHTNVISRDLGNWFFLGEILTTLDLKPDEPEKNRCGTCTRCLHACPTDAILEPFKLDARRCISYLTIELKGSIPEDLRSSIGDRIFGCDDCLAVCPWNRFAREGNLMHSARRDDLKRPDLLALLELDDEQFKKSFQGTPMMRSKRRGLLRNVCVALGNVGDEQALPALEKAKCEPEPLIAEHAQWAIDQILKRHTSSESQ